MRNARILVVEDEAIVARDIHQALESWGYAVPSTAASGEEAIQKTADLSPDLVLMDIVLQGDMDGIEAAEQIRARFDIPVIFLTAFADDEVLQRAKISEPFGYILKPFEERELYTNIEMALHKHQMESQLRESEERFRALIEHSSDIITILEGDGTIRYQSPAFERISGYKSEELIGKSMFEIVHPDDVQNILKALSHNGQDSAAGVPMQLRIRHHDGPWRILEAIGTNLLDNPAVQGVVINSRDVTERVRAEERLRLLSSAIEQSREGIAVSDLEGHLLFINKAFADLHGYAPDELVREHISVFHTPEQLPEVNAANEQIKATGEFSGEIWHTRRDGTAFPALIHNSLLRDAGDNPIGMIGTLRDITERKRIEETLRRRNYELAMLNKANQALSTSLDEKQVFATLLEQVQHLLGVTSASIWLVDTQELEIDDLSQVLPGELVCRQATGPHRELVRGQRLALGQSIVGQVVKSGESLFVPDTQSADAIHAPWYQTVERVERQTGSEIGSVLCVPLRVKKEIIGALQIVDARANALKSTDRMLLESLAATAAIAIEHARLYDQARRDAETKARLLSEVNHRVKNNLSAIIGILYAERQHAEIKDQAVYQSIMQELASRVRGLATAHNLLSRIEWAPPHLSDLVGQVIRSSLQALPPGKHISVDLPPSSIRVTPNQAHHLALVVNELATNTIKHALQGRDTAQISAHVTVDNGTIQFEFRDDGPGYPEEILELQQHNVGFDLIQTIVCEGLRGQLTLYNDHGAVTLVQFTTQAISHTT